MSGPIPPQIKPKQIDLRSSDLAGQASAQTIQQSPELDLSKELHAEAETLPKTYKFTEIRAEDTKDPRLSKILNRFGINASASKYDKAVLSDDGNTLLIVNQGAISLSQLFGGTNGFARFAYKVYGPLMKALGAADKDLAARRYYELFNSSDIDEHGEPLKYLMQALKSGEYHTVTVFHRDPETNKFSSNPVAVAITDAYYHLIDDYVADSMQGQPEEKIKAEIEAKKEKFAKYFTVDKVIPLTASHKDFKDLMHQIVEGLYQAQGFDYLVVPSQIHANTNVNSNDLNYCEVNWHFLRQNKEGGWKITGNPKLLDKIISDKNELDAYTAKMNPTEYSPKITIVRPSKFADQPLDPEIAALQQRSIVSQGRQMRISNKDDRNLIAMTEPVNRYFLQTRA